MYDSVVLGGLGSGVGGDRWFIGVLREGVLDPKTPSETALDTELLSRASSVVLAGGVGGRVGSLPFENVGEPSGVPSKLADPSSDWSRAFALVPDEKGRCESVLGRGSALCALNWVLSCESRLLEAEPAALARSTEIGELSIAHRTRRLLERL